jgi:hypothetical protein
VAGHDKTELFAFHGELRQVYARDLRDPDGDLVYLNEGQALVLRPDCRTGHLICPIPDCTDPRYTTVSGSRRHHFRHAGEGAGGHGKERWFHYTGKHLIAQWLRAKYPDAAVNPEAKVENGQRPDVLCEFPDGRRFGFEIQFAGMTPEEWQRRHDGYRAQGILDIWLFGHTTEHYKLARGEWCEGLLKLNPTLQAVAAAGYRVRFFNPEERWVASRLVETAQHWYRNDPEYAEVAVDALDDCWLEGERFLTPTDLRERRALAARRAAEARAAEEARRAEEDRRRREARAADDEKRREQWLQQKRRDDDLAWEQWQPEFLRRHGLSEMPDVITAPLKGERAIFMHPAHWRSLLFHSAIQGRVGEELTFARASAQFAQHQPKHTNGVWIAVKSYLYRLRNLGYVHLETDFGHIEGATVLADLTNPPTEQMAATMANDGYGVWFAADQGEMILVARSGEVLRRLRPLRAGDELPECSAEVERRRQEATVRAQAQAAFGHAGWDAVRRVESERDREAEIRKDTITIQLPGRIYDHEFQGRLRRVCREHPGEYRLRLIVRRDSGSGYGFGDREISKPERVSADDAFVAAVKELVGDEARAIGVSLPASLASTPR